MSDYKFDMQLIAEQIAENRYGRDFYELPIELQIEVFGEATQEWSDRQADRADFLRKAEREKI